MRWETPLGWIGKVAKVDIVPKTPSMAKQQLLWRAMELGTNDSCAEEREGTATELAASSESHANGMRGWTLHSNRVLPC